MHTKPHYSEGKPMMKAKLARSPLVYLQSTPLAINSHSSSKITANSYADPFLLMTTHMNSTLTDYVQSWFALLCIQCIYLK